MSAIYLIILVLNLICATNGMDPATKDLLTPLTNIGEACGYASCPTIMEGMINVHIVPHTHAELGYTKTFDQHYTGHDDIYVKSEINMKRILDYTVAELWANTARKFTLSDMPYFFHWWSKRDPTVHRMVYELVRQGRLHFVGGGWGMSDEACTNYQALIDHYTFTLRKINKTFLECGRPLVSWQADALGHSREFAALMAMMGFDGHFISPISFDDELARMSRNALEFLWRGSDDIGLESDIFTHKLFDGYWAPPGFCFGGLCKDPLLITSSKLFANIHERVEKFIEAARGRQAPFYTTKNIMVVMGQRFGYYDAAVWFANIDKLIDHVNMKSFQNGSNVRLFYSAPACYLKAVHNAKPQLETKQDDFFPYGYDKFTYATGLYTSRPSLKLLAKEGNIFQQISKQLQVLANLDPNKHSKTLEELQWINGVIQDHNIITGVVRDFVKSYYVKKMYLAIQKSTLLIKKALNNLRGSPNTTIYYRCSFNTSSCRNTNGPRSFIVIYNPLAWTVTLPIRLPIRKFDYVVYDPKGKEIPASIMPIPQPVLDIPTRNTTADHELVFIAEDLPPLGYRSYYIEIRNILAARAKRDAKNLSDRVEKDKSFNIKAKRFEPEYVDIDLDDDDLINEIKQRMRHRNITQIENHDIFDGERYENENSKGNVFSDDLYGTNFNITEKTDQLPDKLIHDESQNFTGKGHDHSDGKKIGRKGELSKPDDKSKIGKNLQDDYDDYDDDNNTSNQYPKIIVGNVTQTDMTGIIEDVSLKAKPDTGEHKINKLTNDTNKDDSIEEFDLVTPRIIVETTTEYEEYYEDSTEAGDNTTEVSIKPILRAQNDIDNVDIDEKATTNSFQVKMDTALKLITTETIVLDDVTRIDSEVSTTSTPSSLTEIKINEQTVTKINQPAMTATFDKTHEEDDKLNIEIPTVKISTEYSFTAENVNVGDGAGYKNRKINTEIADDITTTGHLELITDRATSKINSVSTEIVEDSTTTKNIEVITYGTITDNVVNGDKLSQMKILRISNDIIENKTNINEADDTEEHVKKDILDTKESYFYKEPSSLFIENKYIRIAIDNSTNKIANINMTNGINMQFDVQFYYYESDEPLKTGRKSQKQPGASIFRPLDPKPKPIIDFVETKVYKNSVVEEIHCKYSNYSSFNLKLYHISRIIEIDWTVGPVPIDDDLGKDVFVRYMTNIVNNGTFYTDANGRQTIKRIRSRKPMYEAINSDSVAGNYYPVTSKITIEDLKRNIRLSIFPDRTEGGTSLDDGEIDLMVQRRILTDDRGIQVVLNETHDGKGVVLRGRHLLYISKANTKLNKVIEKKLAKEIQLQPQILASARNVYGGDTQAIWMSHKNEFSGVKNKLPLGIHLLTLEYTDDNLLIRLENYLETSDFHINKTRVVNLKDLFTSLVLGDVKEMTLAANMELKNWVPLQWFTKDKFVRDFNEYYGSNNDVQFSDDGKLNPVEDIDLSNIMLKPQQIRTFIVTYAYLNKT